MYKRQTLHVAAIVHKKEKKEMAALYEKVNCKLPIEIAQKAKADGVKQFVFMSTMSVYGLNSGSINKETPLIPKTLYGKSKFEAERNLREIADDKMCIRDRFSTIEKPISGRAAFSISGLQLS